MSGLDQGVPISIKERNLGESAAKDLLKTAQGK